MIIKVISGVQKSSHEALAFGRGNTITLTPVLGCKFQGGGPCPGLSSLGKTNLCKLQAHLTAITIPGAS